jgi:hypothetical protein
MGRAQIKAAIFALPSGVGDVAFAADDDSTRIDLPLDQWRPITDTIDQFTAMHQVRGIEGDDSLPKPEATGPNGLSIKACLHPAKSSRTE